MTPATVYLDASALTKLVVSESESNALRSFLRAHPQRATSVVATVEVARVALRRQGQTTGPVASVFAGVNVMGLDPAIAARAGTLQPPGLRSLDAIHLASALELMEDLDCVVTYDVRLAEAARAVGVAVASPGTLE